MKLVRKVLPILLVAVCIPVAFFLFTGLFGGKVDQESLSMARQSIQRAAVQCYALEGAYPLDVGHLVERYGVTVDQSRFLVDYRYIASNLMPDITVLPLTE